MERFPPRPFLQGELDGLCGLYSIINGLTWALHTRRAAGDQLAGRARRLRQVEYDELFGELLTELFEYRRTVRLITHGTSSLVLSRLIRRSSEWLGNRRGLVIGVFRPFYRLPRASLRTVTRTISDHLGTPGSTAIIGLEAPWDHWTTVAKVTTWRLRLLDSDGNEHLCLRRHPRHCDAPNSLLQPSSVYLLSVRGKP